MSRAVVVTEYRFVCCCLFGTRESRVVLPGMSGEGLLAKIKQVVEETPLIVAGEAKTERGYFYAGQLSKGSSVWIEIQSVREFLSGVHYATGENACEDLTLWQRDQKEKSAARSAGIAWGEVGPHLADLRTFVERGECTLLEGMKKLRRALFLLRTLRRRMRGQVGLSVINLVQELLTVERFRERWCNPDEWVHISGRDILPRSVIVQSDGTVLMMVNKRGYHTSHPLGEDGIVEKGADAMVKYGINVDTGEMKALVIQVDGTYSRSERALYSYFCMRGDLPTYGIAPLEGVCLWESKSRYDEATGKWERARGIGFHTKIAFVMPLFDGDMLNKKEELKRLPQREKLRIASELAQGIDYLHGHKIIHRDVKLENVLVSRDPVSREHHLFLGDLRRCVNAREVSSPVGGHPIYLPPECKERTERYLSDRSNPELARACIEHTTFGVDVWALGLILHCLFGSRVDEEIANVIAGCLQEDPAVRWMANDVTWALYELQEDRGDFEEEAGGDGFAALPYTSPAAGHA